MEFLKDRDRQLVLLLFDRVEATGNADYVPLPESWRKFDYQKMRQRIKDVIRGLPRRGA